MTRSSAKSKSSKCDSKSHCIPLDLSEVDFFITQSIVMRKSIGEMIHPCLTSDSRLEPEDSYRTLMYGFRVAHNNI